MNKYLAYLNHYDIRPCTAQYLWWFYYLQDHLPNTHFIINKDYLNIDKNRWEYKRYQTAPYKYRNPEELDTKNYTVLKRFKDYPEIIHERIPSKILQKAVSVPNKHLVSDIKDVIRKENVTAAITWCNNASLKVACQICEIPVIHNESGAIRSPWFKDTCYFDFNGVNGETSFFDRFFEFDKIADKVKIFSREELLKIVTPKNNQEYLFKCINTKPTYDCGVALQVDVDTNVLAYNYGIQEADIVNLAVKNFKKVLVRNHPLSSLGYIRPASLGLGEVDTSKNAWEFISKCEHIWTLNSSTAFEALLMGRKVHIEGSNPFYSMQHWEETTLLKALNFAIFSYLIPTPRLYNEYYYNFRMNCFNEEEIYNEGQRYWLEKDWI